MKKTHWLRNTLITLVVCGLAGLLLAVILFNANPGRTGASSTIEFSFKGAAEGLAPNGLRYDLNGFASEEVLNAALADTGLSERYTVDQLRDNLLISGVYPEDIVQQMTGYESLLTGDAGKVAAGDYHATLYNVTLYNDFDKKISRADLEKLLAAVMTEFRAYFEKTYSVFLAEDTLLADLSSYDYPQQAELIESSATRYESFAAQMAEDHSDFLLNGEGFSDIAVRYTTLLDTDMERLTGQITMNALSRDSSRIIAQYENQIRVLKIRMDQLEKESEDTYALIQQYEKDNLIYVSTSDTLQQVGSNSTETYDTLVSRYRSIENSIADQNKRLNQIQLKLADIIGAEAVEAFMEAEVNKEPAAEAEAEAKTGTDAETELEPETEETVKEEETAKEVLQLTEEELEIRKAAVEKGISTVLAKLNGITEDFSAFLKAYSEQEMNDRTVAVTSVKYDTPKLISGEFIKQAVKTAGPLCALGLMVCLICLIRSRSREEKQ